MQITFNRSRFLALLAGCLLSLGSTAQPVELRSHAPAQLVGHEMNLQIERVSGAAQGVPTQGVIVRRYQALGLWTSEGAGGAGHRAASGRYQLHRAGATVLVEQATDASGAFSPATLTYTFDSASTGTWTQRSEPGAVSLSGRFSLVKSQAPAAEQLAPVTNAGLHVALIIKSALAPDLPAGSYPAAGLVLQSYSTDGSLKFQGFGPGTLNSRGTYSYRKVSANTAVEETVQTSDFFTLPYTMVYTFKTPNSGTWYQNFANGLIRFSGTFDTFPR